MAGPGVAIHESAIYPGGKGDGSADLSACNASTRFDFLKKIFIHLFHV